MFKLAGVGYRRLSEAGWRAITDQMPKGGAPLFCLDPLRVSRPPQRPVQCSLRPPVVNNCRLAKQRDYACFCFTCAAYIRHAMLWYVLRTDIHPVVCDTAPQARCSEAGAGRRSWSRDSTFTTCRTEAGGDSTNHASRTCPRAPEGVGGTPAPLPYCRPGARLSCIAQLFPA